MTETFTGIPAPEFLPDDPWFGPAIYSKKQQDYMIDQLVKENLIILENNGSEELDNIHEIMYNLSTRWKLSGGSEKVWQRSTIYMMKTMLIKAVLNHCRR